VHPYQDELKGYLKELSSKEYQDNLIKNINKNSMNYNSKGFFAYKKADWDSAITLFKKAIELDSGNSYAYFNLACTLALKHKKKMTQKITSEIMTHLEKAVSLDSYWCLKVFFDSDLAHLRGEWVSGNEIPSDEVSPFSEIIYFPDGQVKIMNEHIENDFDDGPEIKGGKGESYEEGYMEGDEAGYEEGYHEKWDGAASIDPEELAEWEEVNEEGEEYNASPENGYEEDYEEGYEKGYDEGYAAGNNATYFDGTIRHDSWEGVGPVEESDYDETPPGGIEGTTPDDEEENQNIEEVIIESSGYYQVMGNYVFAYFPEFYMEGDGESDWIKHFSYAIPLDEIESIAR
jgi:hypothetical protein